VCGIAGVIGDWPEREATVERMLAVLRHRGPDDQGIDTRGTGTLGVRRLSVIDVLGGHQPVTNEDGSIIAVQNGELYNFQELKADLLRRGHRFTSQSDTEILPHLYEEFGPSFAEHLRGMFAIALVDRGSGRLVLARDRLGKKPLFYAETAEGLVFASEIHALLTLPLRRDVDAQAIRNYLTFGYVNAPRTAFEAIRKVPPAHVLVSDGRRADLSRYWRISFGPKLDIGEQEALDRLRVGLDDAVRVRRISDVPLGVFLSGGLDSSAVVATMANQGGVIDTFSIGFADEDYSELRYARLVADRFGTRHHEYTVEPSAIEVLPLLVRHLGEPFADASVVPTYYVSQIARRDVTVALNGDGGDELFAGYPRYRAAQLAGAVDAVPHVLRSGAAGIARRLPEIAGVPATRRVRRFAMTLGMSPYRRYQRWTGFFADRPELLGERLCATEDESAWWSEPPADSGATDALDAMLAIDLANYLPGDLLVKMDIASMANSLETRSPFLDHQLLELVARMPSRFKLRGGTSKYLLRRLMAGVLPDRTISRTKMGFGAPVGRWLRGPLRPMVEDLLLADGADRGFVERDVVHEVVGDLFRSPDDNGLLVWSLLMLELWFREVAAPRPVPSR
jgi:asparagine synthase (glutamine-hydrolysing)